MLRHPIADFVAQHKLMHAPVCAAPQTFMQGRQGNQLDKTRYTFKFLQPVLPINLPT